MWLASDGPKPSWRSRRGEAVAAPWAKLVDQTSQPWAAARPLSRKPFAPLTVSKGSTGAGPRTDRVVSVSGREGPLVQRTTPLIAARLLDSSVFVTGFRASPRDHSSGPVAESESCMEHRGWLLAALGAVLGVVLLDETIIGVALDSIRVQLGLSLTAAHWAVNSYLLLFAAFVLVGGRAADRFGHGRVLAVGGVLFAMGSLGAGLATTATMIVGARAVQGFGAAFMFPVSLAMISIAFPPRERGRALGVQVTIGTAFMVAGPVLGGVFAEDFSWRWIFIPNPAVVAVVLAIVAMTWRPPQFRPSAPPIDSIGAMTSVLGSVAVVVALMQGAVWGWSSGPFLVTVATGCCLLGAFWFVERKNPSPLVDVDRFRDRGFSAASLTIFATQFTKGAVIVFLPLYLQRELDASPIEAGLGLLPAIAVAPISGLASGRLTDRLGARPVVLAGLFALVAGLVWIAAATLFDNYWVIVPGAIVWGLAMAGIFPPARLQILSAVPEDKKGEAGAINVASQMFGGTVGIAALGALVVVGAPWATLFATAAAFAALALVVAALAIPAEAQREPPTR